MPFHWGVHPIAYVLSQLRRFGSIECHDHLRQVSSSRVGKQEISAGGAIVCGEEDEDSAATSHR
jgi:hypothetical protein